MERIKTIFLAFSMVFLILSTALGQVKTSIRAGIGVAGYCGTNTDNRFSYKMGAGLDIPLLQHFSLQPAFYFASKGANFKGYYGSEQIMESDYTQKLNYLELPVMMAFKVDLKNDITLIVKGGGYAAWGLNGKTTMEIINTDHKETFRENHFAEACKMNSIAYNTHNNLMTFPKYERLDLGLTAGLELQIKHLLVGGEMSFGLRPFCHNSFTNSTLDDALLEILTLGAHGHPKNYTFNLTLGYEF